MLDFLGTEHTEQLLRPETFAEMVGDLARRMDEPNADSSCVPTYMVSQLARQQVTVAITGDGGMSCLVGIVVTRRHWPPLRGESIR